MVQAPMAMTYFGSGICSYNLTNAGAIFIVTVPATISKSACLGELLGTKPNLSKSNLDPMSAANSIKQHAVPYKSGHKLLNLAQL